MQTKKVKYERIMAPTSTTCRQADQNPLQGKQKYAVKNLHKIKVRGVRPKSKSSIKANFNSERYAEGKRAEKRLVSECIVIEGTIV